MPARLDLPDYDIVYLKDEEGATFQEIKRELELDCHVDTIRRHYHEFNEKTKKIANEAYDRANPVKDYAASRAEKVSWWQRVKNWFRRLFWR